MKACTSGEREQEQEQQQEHAQECSARACVRRAPTQELRCSVAEVVVGELGPVTHHHHPAWVFRLTVTVSTRLVEVAKNARLNRSRHGIAPLPYRGRPWSVSWQLSLWSPRATLQGRWSLVQLRPRQVHRVAGVCLQQGPPALCLSRHAPDQLRPPPDGNALRGQRDVVRLQLAQAVQFAATVCLQSVAPWLHVSPLRAAEQWARGEGRLRL